MNPINSTDYDLKEASFDPKKKEVIRSDSEEQVMGMFENVTHLEWEDW